MKKLVLLVTFLLLSGVLYAQDGRTEASFGIGVAFPQMQFVAFGYFDDIVLEIKSNFGRPNEYDLYENLSPHAFGDPIVNDNVVNTFVFSMGYKVKLHEDSYFTFKRFWLYGTIGILFETIYWEQYDAFHILGDRGHYFVEVYSQTGLICSIGGLYTVSANIGLQVSLDTQTNVGLGVFYIF